MILAVCQVLSPRAVIDTSRGGCNDERQGSSRFRRLWPRFVLQARRGRCCEHQAAPLTIVELVSTNGYTHPSNLIEAELDARQLLIEKGFRLRKRTR